MRTSDSNLEVAAMGLLTALAFAAIVAVAWGGVVAPYSAREIARGGSIETVGHPIPRN